MVFKELAAEPFKFMQNNTDTSLYPVKSASVQNYDLKKTSVKKNT